MLYDPKKWEPKTDLSKPSLRALAYLLRHRELWPVGFVWDFNTCDTCAMGLAAQMWQLEEWPCSYTMTECVSIPEMTSRRLFTANCEEARAITPEMIADRIDALTETASKRR